MIVLALLLAGCTPRDPLAALPPGPHLVGRPAALAPALDRLAGLRDTRLAVTLARVRPDVDACPTFVHVTAGDDGPVVDCAPEDALAPLVALAEGHAAAFVLPDAGFGRLAGTLDVDARGGVVATASMPEPPGGTALDLVLPSGEDPGPDTLPADGALVHARVRQARIADVSTLAGESKHENDIFGLKNQLFAAAMLEGVWEFALWAPREGGVVPEAALAVGVRAPDVARAAAEEYVATLAKRWSFTPTPQRVGETDASCLAGLNLLPELAPCWAIQGGTLVAGWNEKSLSRALGPTTRHEPRSRLHVELAAFPAVDAVLTRAFAPEAPPPDVSYPWSAIELSGTRRDGRLHVDLRAEAP